jgi:hypothetical protein
MFPEPYQPFGFRAEITLNSRIRELYRNGVSEASPTSGQAGARPVGIGP